MKTIWKATVCIVAVLLSFSIYSCGDDDDDAVGSRDLLLGTWNGVYYLSQEWEDGEKVSDSKEDFVNGTNRYSIELKEDGTYVEKDVYNSSRSTNYYHGTWSYSGNKLTLIDTEEKSESRSFGSIFLLQYFLKLIFRQRFVEKIPLDHIAVDRFKEGYLFGSFDTFGDSSDA